MIQLSASLQGAIAEVCAAWSASWKRGSRHQVRAVCKEPLEEEVQSVLGRQGWLAMQA